MGTIFAHAIDSYTFYFCDEPIDIQHIIDSKAKKKIIGNRTVLKICYDDKYIFFCVCCLMQCVYLVRLNLQDKTITSITKIASNKTRG